MMKMRGNKFAGMLMVIGLLLSVAQTNAYGLEQRLYFVNNEEDLIQLAENCTLDTYSQGLKVILNADIQISDENFKGIPTFGGEFNGRNYTISDVKLTRDGSTFGLFRYIQTTGIVQDLKVEVNFQPTGTENRIGGIAGENRGIVENCDVYGILKGKNHVGGIVAKNQETGQIINCTFTGKLTGENFSGGIAGENFGLIKNSRNKGAVNTTVTSSTLKLKDINFSEINSAEEIITSTNSGGITGFNRGIMEGCVNEGVVGYPHVGYNVGGIAGRQDGYIGSSVNYGDVFGRKDVGGIVGQMEPYQVLKYKEDFFEKLKVEMDTLQASINQAYDQVDESNGEVNNQIEAVNQSMSDVSSKLENLSDQTIDYADENIQTINDTLNRIDSAVIDLKSTTEELKNSTEDLSAGMKHIDNGFISLSIASHLLDKGVGKIDDGFDKVGQAFDGINDGANQMEEGLDRLDSAIVNNESLDQSIEAITSGMGAVNKGFDAAMAALLALPDLLSGIDDVDIDEIVDLMVDDMDASRANFSLAAVEMDKALGHLQDEIENDSNEVSLAMTSFKQVTSYFKTGLDCLGHAVNDFSKSTSYFERAAKTMSGGMSAFSVASTDFQNASDHLTIAMDQINRIVDREAELGAPQFSFLEDSVEGASREFFTASDKLTAEVIALNHISKANADVLANDLRAVNDQLFVVVDLIQEGYETLMDDDIEIFEDISDDELLGTDMANLKEQGPTFGYVLDCVNVGEVSGDINVGGITGTLAIDYDFDPEGDLTSEKSHTLNFQFQTKGVLAGCENSGLVTAKKDYAGGIVGRMDLGSLVGCFNNSKVVSSDGNYVGGIAGGSYSVIRNSYSLSHLSGIDYIGGITGFGTEIVGCTALVSIDEAAEFIGMIAGDVEDGMFEEDSKQAETSVGIEIENLDTQPVVLNNRFVSEDWAGIDGISYSKKAEPVAYEDLLADENLPETFRQLKLTFVANEMKVEYPFAYEESIDVKDLPEIPEKSGYFGQWPEYNFDQLMFPDTIEAEYVSLIQVLASEEEGKAAQILVEGSFTPGASLELVADSETRMDLLTDMEKISQWHVAIKGNGIPNESYTFRYYSPDQKMSELFAWKDNGWQKLDTVLDGSYLVFQWPQEELVFTVYKEGIDPTIYIGAGSLALLLALILVINARKKRRVAKNG